MKRSYYERSNQSTVMKVPVHTLMLLTCVAIVRCNNLPLDFVNDFVRNLGITDLTFVLGDTNLPTIRNIFFNLSGLVRIKCITYCGPECMQETVNEILGIDISSSNSAIFFTGFDLLPVLANIESLDFFKKDVISMLDYRLLSVSLKWRLDSKVFFYDIKSSEEVIMTEKYAIKGGQPIIKEFGSWVQEIGLRSFYTTGSQDQRFSLPNLRSDLMGATLVNAALEFPREVYFIKDNQGNIIGSTGYLQEILQALQHALNFTVTTITPADGKYGGLEDDNKTWNGLIGLLDRKDADIVTSPMARTEARSEVADYTFPVAQDKLTLCAKKRSTGVPNIWVYMKIFTPIAWLCIGCLLILIALLLSLFGWFDPASNSSIGLALSASYKMLLQISSNLTIDFASSRFLFMAGSIYAYLMYIIFTADLTANMTIRSNKVSVRNFYDVLEQDFQVYVWEDAVAHQVLANAVPGSAMHEVYYKTMHQKDQVFYTGNDMANDILTHNPQALLFSYGALTPYAVKDSQALVIDEISRIYGSFCAQKDSELTGILR